MTTQATYYAPEQEQHVMEIVNSLKKQLTQAQQAAIVPVKRFMDSMRITQRFHAPQFMETPAGVLMLAEAVALANFSGWQEKPAQSNLEYLVFSTPALTHLEHKRKQAEKMFQYLYPERVISKQKTILEPIFKLQRSTGQEEAYISYANQYSLYRDIIIDRGNQLPLELTAELFYIPLENDDLQTRAKIREFLK